MYATLVSAGDRAAARQTLLDGLPQLGELPIAQVTLAQAAAAEGNQPLAANLLRAALKGEPENAHARVQLATLTDEQPMRSAAQPAVSPAIKPRATQTPPAPRVAHHAPRVASAVEPRSEVNVPPRAFTQPKASAPIKRKPSFSSKP
jgi:hypothetical protein